MTRYETNTHYHIVKIKPRMLKFVAKPPYGLSEQFMDPVQDWSKQTNCGIRTSFDTFKFRSEKEITMFLLRWA